MLDKLPRVHQCPDCGQWFGSAESLGSHHWYWRARGLLCPGAKTKRRQRRAS